MLQLAVVGGGENVHTTFHQEHHDI
jgi:hypothetical protein